MFNQVSVNREVFGKGENLLICGSAMTLPEEIRNLYGKIQCVYLDPPFMTGEKFMRRRPYGTAGWKTGVPSPRYPAYDDRYTSEKDYLRHIKESGYRSYHMIVEADTPFPGPVGGGAFYAEVQLRTIAMDTWAALEHEITYKRELSRRDLIWEELKRCADELAACDVSMQAIRDMIRESGERTDG